MNQYLQRAQQMAAEIVENRRYIHSHAGVGFDVGDTVDRIMSQLAEAGIQGEVCGQSGGSAGVCRQLFQSAGACSQLFQPVRAGREIHGRTGFCASRPG